MILNDTIIISIYCIDMIDLIEKVLKIIGRFNCVSNRTQLDQQENKMVELNNKMEALESRLSRYYDKETVNVFLDNIKIQLENNANHINDMIQNVQTKVNSNEEQITMNHNLLYEKHQEINERLHSEVHKNSIGLAEIKGILQRSRTPSSPGNRSHYAGAIKGGYKTRTSNWR